MESRLFNLSGRTALVTGGGRGIGLAIARGLAEHGADVAIVARTKEQLEEAARQIETETGRKVWIFQFDLAKVELLEGLFESLIAETGGIDILVNCAGATIRGAAEEVDLKTWNQVIEINLTSAFVLSQAFCRHRKKQGKAGKIINIGSLTCHGARPTTAAYASSKGGLLMLTKTLAVEWAKYNINVNAIGPGYIATELTEPLWTDDEFNRWVHSKTPLGRWGRPEDLAGTAVLLASKAGDFITGQIIYVDGGWLALL
ncbi:MAG: gluconate 5-dehydrogenase [Planctomycetes bacterium B3_Pla]|nr:MAG: gluconate 5-dehydrogenase [Planctomycetes bacterium B3_Pla]